jgi:hypothetical protein
LSKECLKCLARIDSFWLTFLDPLTRTDYLFS